MALEAPADRERARGSPLPGSQDRGDRKQAARLIEVMAYSLLIGRRHMRFVLVNGRTARPQSFCAWYCEPIGESYLRELATDFSYCNHDCYLSHCRIPDRVLQSHVSTRNARVS
jgi:hypothetical protein